MCFSYPPDLPDSPNLSVARPAPAGRRSMPLPCFSYPHMCFSYPADVPLGNRDTAQPAEPGPRRMPHTCFRY
jgi:hypothetical protein